MALWRTKSRTRNDRPVSLAGDRQKAIECRAHAAFAVPEVPDPCLAGLLHAAGRRGPLSPVVRAAPGRLLQRCAPLELRAQGAHFAMQAVAVRAEGERQQQHALGGEDLDAVLLDSLARLREQCGVRRCRHVSDARRAAGAEWAARVLLSDWRRRAALLAHSGRQSASTRITQAGSCLVQTPRVRERACEHLLCFWAGLSEVAISPDEACADD